MCNLLKHIARSNRVEIKRIEENKIDSRQKTTTKNEPKEANSWSMRQILLDFIAIEMNELNKNDRAMPRFDDKQ